MIRLPPMEPLPGWSTPHKRPQRFAMSPDLLAYLREAQVYDTRMRGVAVQTGHDEGRTAAYYEGSLHTVNNILDLPYEVITQCH